MSKKANIQKPKSAKKQKAIETPLSRIEHSKELKYFLYFVVCIAPALTAYYYYNYASTINNFLSFPLDDPWIHLTFAKNLKEYFSFSYFKNENATAGSTSPLFVFLMAIGFFITNNEMLLAYVLGILFFIVSCYYFYRLSLMSFNNELILALICTLVFTFDFMMNFISLSGMETTMFIFLLIFSAYLYKEKKAVPLGIALGLLIWTRPDGIAFVAAIVCDYLYKRYFVKNSERGNNFSLRQLIIIISIFSIFIFLYGLMNIILSGTILPNTYGAKISHNVDTAQRINFLTSFLWSQYTFHHYSILMAGFIFSVLKFVYDLIRKKNNQSSLYILFIFLFIIMYVIKLPTISKFGRYQLPVAPFFILVSLTGFIEIILLAKYIFKERIIATILTYLSFIVVLYMAVDYYFVFKQVYADECKFIYNRQVTVAKWFKENTKADDIISTHDVGAIGFYSNRKIVDIAGLVTPELIDKLNDPDYIKTVTEYMNKQGVSYTAYFREFFNIKNQNPLFVTPKENEREVFQIYKFIPGKSEILSAEANRILYLTIFRAATLSGTEIVENMNKVLEIEPDCASAYYMKSVGYSMLQDDKNTAESFIKALSLQPDFIIALMDYGDFISRKQNKPAEARQYFQKVLEIEPSNEKAKEKIRLIDAFLNR